MPEQQQLILIRHQSALRVVAEAEVLDTLSLGDLALPRRDFEIDTRPYAEDVEGGHWRTSHRNARTAAAAIRAAADQSGATRLLHFGIAEVPDLLALGAYLGDERQVEVYDFNRDIGDWKWPGSGRTIELTIDNLPREHVPQPGAAVVRVEVSYPIDEAEVNAVVDPERVADVRVRPADGRSPSPALVSSPEDVAAVRVEFRRALQAILTARPGTEVIHLFVAAPASVCLAIGQELRLRNGRDVQTYRYRRVPGERAYTPAILLTTGDVQELAAPLTEADIALAARLRAVWQAALGEVAKYAEELQRQCGDRIGSWYEYLEYQEAAQVARPFGQLVPLWETVQSRDTVSTEPRSEDYAFDKDQRAWRLSDRLLLGFYRGVGGNEGKMQELIRLFLFHEYLHDWQDLTKYTAEDVGSFANCLERIDYMADTYALLHQLDFALRHQSQLVRSERDKTGFLRDQIDLMIRSFWAFQPPAPHFEWQERRLRRYLNWFWRRVQMREAANLAHALLVLANLPCIEIAGLQYRTGRGRVFVVLNQVRLQDVLEIGVVLEDGRFDRRGSTTDLSITEVLAAFSRHDHEAIDRFFSSLFEHLNQTGGALPPAP